MTAKEYLISSLDLERLICAKRRLLKKLQAQSTGLSSVRMGDRVRSSNISTMAVIDKIVDLESEILAKENDLVEKQKEIMHKIQLIYHPKLTAVLIDKYINGMSIEQIAEAMGVSVRTVCVWHGQALQLFREETGMK